MVSKCVTHAPSHAKLNIEHCSLGSCKSFLLGRLNTKPFILHGGDGTRFQDVLVNADQRHLGLQQLQFSETRKVEVLTTNTKNARVDSYRPPE